MIIFCSNESIIGVLGPEHTGHFVQPQVAAFLWRTRAHWGDMYVIYANALSVAGTSHSLSHT